MKTTNVIRKSENKKFEKVMSKIFAAAFGLVLISFIVSAQDFQKQLSGNYELSRKAILIVDQENENMTLLASTNPLFAGHSSETDVAFPTLTVETEKDKSLEIENWMTDSNYFGQAVWYAEGKDQPLEVEDWMTDPGNFCSSPVTIADEIEQEMKIESWMTGEYFRGN